MESSALPEPPRQPGQAVAGQGSRGGRRRALSKEVVLDAAMAIVDAEGLDALTMRTLAASLGTGAASLYAYVSSKDDLVEQLVDRVIGEMPFGGEPDPARWREQVMTTASAMRAAWTRHGDLARASFARVPLGENALLGSEWMSSVLRAGGLSDRTIGLAIDLISLYVGAIAYEDSIGSADGASPEEIERFAAELEGYFRALPPERFPNLVALAGALTVPGDRFAFGLEVILAGLEAIDRRGGGGSPDGEV